MVLYVYVCARMTFRLKFPAIQYLLLSMSPWHCHESNSHMMNWWWQSLIISVAFYFCTSHKIITWEVKNTQKQKRATKRWTPCWNNLLLSSLNYRKNIENFPPAPFPHTARADGKVYRIYFVCDISESKLNNIT
jgi:hypothetical protein